jgi:hypothetical protein
MLKILGLTNTPSKGYEYTKRLNSTRNKNSSMKSTKSSIPSTKKKKEFSKLANDNTAKKKSQKKSRIKNFENKNINFDSYQYIHQKAKNYINVPVVNNINNNIVINGNNSSEKNKVKLTSSICLNKNKRNIHKRKSIEDQGIKNVKMHNLTTDKKIKEIKIKSNFNLSYINLFVNKSNNNSNENIQNQTTIGNNSRMSTVSNRNKNKGNIFDENNDISFDKNKTLLNSISCGVYHRKKLKIFNSSSMEKRPRKQKTIESIEINFGPKSYINNFQPYITPQQSLYMNKKEKIIKIQKNFRKYLMRKYKGILDEKIMEGLINMNIFVKRKIFFSFKNIVLGNTKSRNIINVEESQIELLNALKEKNIYSMNDLKRYIVYLLKNNKLEMF